MTSSWIRARTSGVVDALAVGVEVDEAAALAAPRAGRGPCSRHGAGAGWGWTGSRWWPREPGVPAAGRSASAEPPERARRRGCATPPGRARSSRCRARARGRGRPPRAAARPRRAARPRGRSPPSSAPGTKTTYARASSAASLRIVWARPPAMWTTSPGPAHDPLDRAARILDVQAELPRLDAVDLGRRVAVQAGRAAARGHPHLARRRARRRSARSSRGRRSRRRRRGGGQSDRSRQASCPSAWCGKIDRSPADVNVAPRHHRARRAREPRDPAARAVPRDVGRAPRRGSTPPATAPSARPTAPSCSSSTTTARA